MTLIRALIIVVIVAACALAGGSGTAASASQASEPRVIEITVRRYAFEPAEIQVMTGESVRFVVKSGDGLHGFSVPRLKIEKEIPRGETVIIDFTAKTAGEFPILCSEFCGDGHEDMKGMLIVTAVVPDAQ
jgi:cytochrome c oxidase subunit 2